MVDLNCKRLVAQLTLCVTLCIGGCASIHFSNKPRAYEPEQADFGRIHVAVVLGSGGVRGLAHVGVLEVLSQAGIKPDLIVGSSAGSIVGAMYAEGQPLSQIRRKLIHTDANELFAMSPGNLPMSLYQNENLERYLSKIIHSKKFSQLKIPFIAVATNLEFGKETAFSKGALIQKIQASSAVPGLYMPVMIAGQPFVDGAVSQPIPVSVAKDAGAAITIAVDVGNRLPITKPSNFFGVMMRSLEISFIHSSKMAAKEADVVIRVPFEDQSAFDSHDNEKIYQMGRSAALAKLDEIRLVVRRKLLKQIVN